VIGLTTYHLELPAHWKIHDAFHATDASLLLPYYETKEHGRNFLKPSPELIEGQLEWEVENILDSRQHRHKLQYLIKWKGYSNAHNSWEPKENVNVPTLLTAFHKRKLAAIKVQKWMIDDCTPRMRSLGSKKCTKDKTTLPQKTRITPVLIRSIRMMGTSPRMSPK
jgi:hypothetical protein